MLRQVANQTLKWLVSVQKSLILVCLPLIHMSGYSPNIKWSDNLIHNRQILDMARLVKIRSMEAIFLVFIQCMQCTNPMNAFPKIPIENSPATMIIKVLFTSSDMLKQRNSQFVPI